MHLDHTKFYGGVLGVDNTKSALAQVTPSSGFFKKLGPQMSLASNTLAYLSTFFKNVNKQLKSADFFSDVKISKKLIGESFGKFLR